MRKALAGSTRRGCCRAGERARWPPGTPHSPASNPPHLTSRGEPAVALTRLARGEGRPGCPVSWAQGHCRCGDAIAQAGAEGLRP